MANSALLPALVLVQEFTQQKLKVAELYWIWKGVWSYKNPYLHLRKTYPWKKLGYDKKSFFEPR